MRRVAFLLVAAFILPLLASCSAGGNGQQNTPPKDAVVADEFWTLKDGESHSLKLEPGMYRIEMTASGDGAQVEWVGADCAKSTEVKTYSSVCELTRTGQVVISNPTSFGMGQAATVTVKITKMAR